MKFSHLQAFFVFHHIKNSPSTLDYKQSKVSKPLSKMEHNPQGDVQETRNRQQVMSHMISLFTYQTYFKIHHTGTSKINQTWQRQQL